VGKVGSELARLLLERGCRITIADVSVEAVEAIRAIGPTEVTDPEQIHRVECDLFAPCALGGALNERSISELNCAAIVGAANNQLSSPEIADALRSESITYIPDFLANAGGVINIAHEHLGYDIEKARAHVQEIYTTTRTILGRSGEQQITPLRAALALAEERLVHPQLP
jgi:glutamate dehydrogenase/leucine dehydrogenase